MGELIYNLYEAKTSLSRLVDRAAAGEEIVIAKAGTPWVKLVPLQDKRQRRRPGIAHGAVTDAFFDPLPDDELDAWGS